MSEIKLPKLCPRSEIEGKTISKINCKLWDTQELIILFTDNTFIYVGSRSIGDDGTEIEINNIKDKICDYDYEKVLNVAAVPIQVIEMLKQDYWKTVDEQRRLEKERKERAEYERLKAKYGNQTTTTNGAT